VNLVFLNTVPLWGGGEVWTLDSARAFAARGHDVTVMAAADGALLERARSAGIPSIGLPRAGLARRRAAGRFRDSRRSRFPDVVVALTGRDARLASHLRPRGGRGAVVLSRHLSRELPSRLLRRLTLGHLDLVVANSQATRAAMRRSLPWMPEDRIVTVYNPFDAEAFRAYPPRDVRRLHAVPPDAPVITVVGRLDRGKGQEVLLRAMPHILAELPETVLLVVGEGPEGERLAGAARDLGIASSCRFLGYVDPVQPCYETSDVVAVPSFHEGFCYAAVEAQGLGRPLVASRVGSLPEVMAEGKSGLLVPPGEPAPLAKALLELLGDEERRRAMGREGTTFVEKFAPGGIYDELERLFRGVAGS
jgi:glycosyltransferase involved in cell wall biosynthesis